MPTINLNRKMFESLVGKKLSIEEIKEKLPLTGASLESVNDSEIIIEVTPNRPDFLSEQGMARAFSSFLGVKTGLKKYDVKDSGEKLIVDASVKGIRPFTACAIVKGIKFDDEKIKEIIQIQEKLHITYGRKRKRAAIGVYPLDKLKFPITYFAEDPKKIKFRPLEYNAEIDGLQVLSRHPTGKEYAHLMDGLKKFAFFKDADDNILSMPPIINSHDVGKISESTRDVFIECSGFDLPVLKVCLNMIVAALADMGGLVYSVTMDYSGKKIKTPDFTPEKMKIDYDYVNKRLGTNLSKKEIDFCLERMGFGVEKGVALVPAYRSDVLHMIDLVEDIAIAYGYDNLKPSIPKVATIGKETDFEKFKDKLSDLLVGLGLIEVETYNLSSADKQTVMMKQKLDLVRLHNALNKEYDVMRHWLIPSMLEVLNSNRNNEYPQNIFGVGNVFKHGNTDVGVIQEEFLSVALCSDAADYTKARQVLDFLMRMLDLKCEVKDAVNDSFIHGRVGKVIVNNKEIAVLGDISPEVLSNWALDMPVAALEINLSELFALLKK